MARHLAFLLLATGSLVAQGPPYSGWTVSPVGGPVSSTQTFTIHLSPPPAGEDPYYQVYMRIESRSGDPFQYWDSCGVIFNAPTNSFFLEDNGAAGQAPVPWLTRNGGPILGGESYTFENNQCIFHGDLSWATSDSNRAVDAQVTLTFKRPAFISNLWPSPQYASSPTVRWVWLLGYNGYWWGWDLKGTISIPPDTMPPQIFSVWPPSGGGTQMSWQTDEPATSQVRYSVDQSNWVTLADSQLLTGHSLSLTGLVSGQTYYYEIRSTDASNNTRTESGTFSAQAACPELRVIKRAVRTNFNNIFFRVVAFAASGNPSGVFGTIEGEVHYVDPSGNDYIIESSGPVSAQLGPIVPGDPTAPSYNPSSQNPNWVVNVPLEPRGNGRYYVRGRANFTGPCGVPIPWSSSPTQEVKRPGAPSFSDGFKAPFYLYGLQTSGAGGDRYSRTSNLVAGPTNWDNGGLVFHQWEVTPTPDIQGMVSHECDTEGLPRCGNV